MVVTEFLFDEGDVILGFAGVLVDIRSIVVASLVRSAEFEVETAPSSSELSTGKPEVVTNGVISASASFVVLAPPGVLK